MRLPLLIGKLLLDADLQASVIQIFESLGLQGIVPKLNRVALHGRFLFLARAFGSTFFKLSL